MELKRHNERMVFDWDKAAHIIKERKPICAKAGLCEDWEWSVGTIYTNGRMIEDERAYLASVWATPQLDIDGEMISCFKMQSETPGWDEDTLWPKSAQDILYS